MASGSEKIIRQARISAQRVFILQRTCVTIRGTRSTPVIVKIMMLDISRGLEVVSIALEDVTILGPVGFEATVGLFFIE